ncbi:DUF5641 domain-containing protein [Trichonephila inaurata madagascariensis]|uniref:DUF5641 domain-containing protein n=1 Tax=Trichonephila inaurata madagascariensis TaxID=2747483 RepID=A0A8X7CAH9_9ARAC|nr:DUF5641 domain-containing protein [Trichonephila inaurata madagascariensis]
MASDGQRIIHRRLSRDYSDSSDDSDDNASVKKAPVTTSMKIASQVTSAKVPEKNGLVLKPSLSLEPYDVAFKNPMVQIHARVDPIKIITIQILELLTCTIRFRFVNTTRIDLGLENGECVPLCCWPNSVNALYSITCEENWGTFVNNRVQEIRRLTNPED